MARKLNDQNSKLIIELSFSKCGSANRPDGPQDDLGQDAEDDCHSEFDDSLSRELLHSDFEFAFEGFDI